MLPGLPARLSADNGDPMFRRRSPASEARLLCWGWMNGFEVACQRLNLLPGENAAAILRVVIPLA